MADKISIDRTSAGGRYANILDVAEHLSDLYGSSVNALAIMVRQSRLFQNTWKSEEFKRALAAKAAAAGGPEPGAP